MTKLSILGKSKYICFLYIILSEKMYMLIDFKINILITTRKSRKSTHLTAATLSKSVTSQNFGFYYIIYSSTIQNEYFKSYSIPCNLLFKESLWTANSCPSSANNKLLLLPPWTTEVASLSLAPTWNDLSWSLSAGISIRACINGISKVYNGLRCIAIWRSQKWKKNIGLNFLKAFFSYLPIKSRNFQRGATSPKTTTSPPLFWCPPLRFPISLMVRAILNHSLFSWDS